MKGNNAGRVAMAIRILAVLAMAAILLLLLSGRAFAAADWGMVKTRLEDWSDELSAHALYKDIFRWVGINVVYYLALFCESLEEAAEAVYGLLAEGVGIFSVGAGVAEYYQKLRPLVIALLAIGIAFFGYYLIFKRSDTQISGVQNLIAILLVVTVMPVVAESMGQATYAFSADVRGMQTATASGKRTAAMQIVNANIIDLVYVDSHYPGKEMPKKGEVLKKGANKNGANLERIGQLRAMGDPINDVVKEQDVEDDDFFTHYLAVGSSGRTEAQPIAHWFTAAAFERYYYVYSVHWFTIMFTLLAMALTLLFTCIKAGRLIIDAAMSVLIAPFVAVSDLASGQRLKEFLRHFVSLFAVLFLVSMLLGLYFIGAQFLQARIQDEHPILYIILLIVLSFAIIDGPNIIERILGIDAGIKSGYQMLVGGYAAARGAAGATKGAAGIVRKTASGAAKTGKMATRAVVGSGMKRDKFGERSIGGIAGKAVDMKQRAGKKGPQKDAEAQKGRAPIRDGVKSYRESFQRHNADGSKSIRTASSQRHDAEQSAREKRGLSSEQRSSHKSTGEHFQKEGGIMKGMRKEGGSGTERRPQRIRPASAAGAQAGGRPSGAYAPFSKATAASAPARPRSDTASAAAMQMRSERTGLNMKSGAAPKAAVPRTGADSSSRGGAPRISAARGAGSTRHASPTMRQGAQAIRPGRTPSAPSSATSPAKGAASPARPPARPPAKPQGTTRREAAKNGTPRPARKDSGQE
jgi:hypothetical protein